MDKIRAGVRRFQKEIFPQRREAYESVAADQRPHALFITCADSRVDPELITGSGPGELFVNRNVGNIVPIYGVARAGVAAAIEYAVALLKVRYIIVCGHSDCGAMKGILNPETLDQVPAVASWLRFVRPAKQTLDEQHAALEGDARLARLTEINVLQQMENLKTHPSVEQRLKDGSLAIQGWVFQIRTGTVLAFDPATGAFQPWPE
jgi:carbonic anhydrase